MVGHALHGRGNSTLRSIVAETGEADNVKKAFVAPYGGSESVWALHNTVMTSGKEGLNFLFLFSNEVSVEFVPVK